MRSLPVEEKSPENLEKFIGSTISITTLKDPDEPEGSDVDEMTENKKAIIYSPVYNFPISKLLGKFIWLRNEGDKGEDYTDCYFKVADVSKENPPNNTESEFKMWLIDENNQKYPLYEESLVVVIN